LPGDMEALLKVMEADTKAADEGRRR